MRGRSLRPESRTSTRTFWPVADTVSVTEPVSSSTPPWRTLLVTISVASSRGSQPSFGDLVREGLGQGSARIRSGARAAGDLDLAVSHTEADQVVFPDLISSV